MENAMSFGHFSRRRSLLTFAAAAAALPLGLGRAAPASENGLAVLTVGGLIGAPNRGPSSEASDPFLNHNNLSFGKGRRFTMADLCALPQQTVKAQAYAGDTDYKGPLLSSILAAAQPLQTAKTARLSALDGYGVELSLADIDAQKWILAVEAGGNAFGIGDFGPLYTLRQLPPGEKRSDEESAKWIFSVYYIELMA
jgi:hypothetical protein